MGDKSLDMFKFDVAVEWGDEQVDGKQMKEKKTEQAGRATARTNPAQGQHINYKLTNSASRRLSLDRDINNVGLLAA